MLTDLVATRGTGFDIRPPTHDRATPVADDIWLSPGLSNSYLVTTGDGRVVVNTGMGFEAPVHRAVYDEVDDSPVRYVVLTQGHVDHVGGVDLFLEEGTEVVAQRNNAACQADDARIHAFRVGRSMPYWADAIAAADSHIRKHTGDAVPGQASPVPTITFDDHLSLDVGGLQMELLSVPGGETIDSLCLWLPQRGIAFVGNLFSALFGHMPNLVTMRGDRYRFVPAFLDSLDRVLALEPEMLLTGHFDPVVGAGLVRSELERIRDGVDYVHTATVDGMNEGKDLWTLMREVRPPDDLEIGEGYGKIDWGVRAIWEGYTGWFHAESTTELYPVPPSDAYIEVVALAGGPGTVAARAIEIADQGRPVHAIHLAEMAESADPDAADTIAALLHAHRILLGDVEGRNFWETGWLETKIAELERRLEEVRR